MPLRVRRVKTRLGRLASLLLAGQQLIQIQPFRLIRISGEVAPHQLQRLAMLFRSLHRNAIGKLLVFVLRYQPPVDQIVRRAIGAVRHDARSRILADSRQ
jgi:hypothetical protein